MSDQITISEKEYEELLEDSMKLNALVQNKVEKWYGYDDAMDIFEEMKKNDIN